MTMHAFAMHACMRMQTLMRGMARHSAYARALGASQAFVAHIKQLTCHWVAIQPALRRGDAAVAGAGLGGAAPQQAAAIRACIDLAGPGLNAHGYPMPQPCAYAVVSCKVW